MHFGDLHAHTTVSDANKTDTERILQIQSLDPKNDGIWAMTNHDRYSPWFVERARWVWIKAIWATEISAHSNELDLSLHVTCYTPYLSESIRTLIDAVISWRKNKVLGQIEMLQSRGFPINQEDFFSWIVSERMSPDSATNWHIAHYLWKQKDALRIVTDLTGWSVRTELDFMRECLRENGDHADIGYHRVPQYEPELSTLVDIASREDMILSVAHPNCSFTKYLNKKYGSTNTQEHIERFHSQIVPILSTIWIHNYEVNTLASPEWTDAILKTVETTGGYVTYWSDNHGLEYPDDKHGIFGQINPNINYTHIQLLQEKLHTFL